MRLNSDGTLDTTFNATPNNAVYSLALQADGEIFAGGSFTYLNGIWQNYFARLNSDGTMDTNFVASTSGTVNSIAIQPDGKVLVGGEFSNLYYSQYDWFCDGLGRLRNTEAATGSLTYNGSNITWLRGGASPEFAWVSFDSSNDGITWHPLGTGVRMSGGWQLTGVATTVTNCIRGWGYVPCGQYNGSGWYVENALLFASNVPPTIVANDNSFGGFGTGATNGFSFNIAALRVRSKIKAGFKGVCQT
jgi:hypothetical protein